MTTLFGIKNCDTVKKARKWLDDQSINYDFHDFRIDGTDQQQVSSWLIALGAEVLINKRSTTWKQLSENDKQSLNDTSAITLILENPTLIKRPLLENKGNYYVGFNEKTYKTIFS